MSIINNNNNKLDNLNKKKNVCNTKIESNHTTSSSDDISVSDPHEYREMINSLDICNTQFRNKTKIYICEKYRNTNISKSDTSHKNKCSITTSCSISDDKIKKHKISKLKNRKKCNNSSSESNSDSSSRSRSSSESETKSSSSNCKNKNKNKNKLKVNKCTKKENCKCSQCNFSNEIKKYRLPYQYSKECSIHELIQ
jgi:hypothetical protein